MLRKESEAVPKGNGPAPQKEESGSGQPTLGDVYRMMKEALNRWDRKLDEISDKMEEYIEERTSIDQRLIRLEYGARQPRLAMEADGHANAKTQERTEGAATAVPPMRGDSFSTRWAEPGPNTNSTSFGVKAKSPALPCRDDVVVESGDAAPKLCLPSLEMRSSTAAGGLVPTGEASTPTDTSSTATETNLNQSPLRFYTTKETDSEARSKETNLRTSTPYASYDSSVFQESNLSAAPYCWRVVETKSRQNRTLDPGGSQGYLRACPFLGSWRALVCGKVVRAGAAGKDCSSFLEDR